MLFPHGRKPVDILKHTSGIIVLIITPAGLRGVVVEACMLFFDGQRPMCILYKKEGVLVSNVFHQILHLAHVDLVKIRV